MARRWRRQRSTARAGQNRAAAVETRFSRREVFKLGLVTGAGYLATKAGLSVVARAGSDDEPQGPPTTPFQEELPIPPVAQPVPALDPVPQECPVAGEAPRACHQRWAEFLPRKFYEIRAREARHRFHPQLPESVVWGFGGICPGPVIHARYGEPIVVRFRNDLPANHAGFGVPEITVHLHNAHTASESDGFAADFYRSGLFKDNHYANFYAGGDVREALSTLWYHDHRMHFTAQNVYRGLAGFYLLFNEYDSGDETDPSPGAFRLPSGSCDVPLMFADKALDANGQLYFDVFNTDGILGDKYTVNGKIQPYFRVARRKYRFRLLNAGPSRFYEFFLSDDQPFTLIAADGNLLPAPVQVRSVRLGVAERADIIVDFSRYRIGDRVVLENRLEQDDGRGPTGKILDRDEAVPLLRFDVDRDAADPSRVPDTFYNLPPANPDTAVRTRTWRFERQQGAWAVNGRFFDPGRVDATPKLNTAEVWVLRNNSGGWSHPIHIHLEEFRILSRNGRPPSAAEAGRKDVVRLGPNDEVRVFLRFRDFTGRYLMHCHNTLHEDHGMMIRWDVVP